MLCYLSYNQPAKIARGMRKRGHRMMMQQSDHLQEHAPLPRTELSTYAGRYYVELALEALDEQGSLLDSLIDFTFDTLNAQYLDLRIIAETH